MHAFHQAMTSVFGAVGNLQEFRTQPASLADYLPWAALLARGLVVNKDGSLQRTIAFRGPDLDSATDSELMRHRQLFNGVLARLGSQWCVHVEAARRPASTYLDGSRFTDPASLMVDLERRATFEAQGQQFETRCYLTLTFLPRGDFRGLLDVFMEDEEGRNETLARREGERRYRQSDPTIGPWLGKERQMRPANNNSESRKSCLLALHRACDGLPQDQLDLLLRVYGDGASYIEVAIEQDVPSAIIRGEVAKARIAAIRRQQRRPHPVYGRGAFEPELLEQLVAHVDDELDPVDQRQIEQRLRHDDAARYFVWELEKTKRQLRRLWAWMDARPSLYLAEVAASSRAAEGKGFHDFVRELAAYAEGELEDPAARALVARIQREPHLRKTAAEVCTAVTELRQIYSRSDVAELPDAMVTLLRLFPLHVPPRFARRVDRG